MVSEQDTLIKTQSIRLDNFEQRFNRNKLVINNVSLEQMENLHDVAVTIASKLNVQITSSDIQDVFRVDKGTKKTSHRLHKNNKLATDEPATDEPATDEPI